MIGKRKRDTSVVSRTARTSSPESTETTNHAPASSDDISSQEIFRRYFESRFLPLDLPKRPDNGRTAEGQRESGVDNSEGEEDDDDEDSQNEWDGISEGEGVEEEGQVEVVECKDTRNMNDHVVDKKARKAFMVGLYI